MRMRTNEDPFSSSPGLEKEKYGKPKKCANLRVLVIGVESGLRVAFYYYVESTTYLGESQNILLLAITTHTIPYKYSY